MATLAVAGCGDDEPAASSDATATSSSSGSGSGASGGAGGDGGAASSSSAGGSGTGGVPVDPDFACEGVAWPSMAPDTVVIGGVVYDSVTKAPLAGATVTTLALADGATLDTTTSDAAGAYGSTLPTGGDAVAIYHRVEAPGYVTSYTVPPFAFWQDEPMRNLPALSIENREGLAALLGTTVDPATAVLVLNARDCGGAAVPGATVTLSPPAEVTGYMDDTGTHLGDLTGSDGVLLAAGVPAGLQDPIIELDGHTWRSWPIEVLADSMVYTPRRP